ncbi:D-alanyl-D-alanine carboxypeptidase [Streptomyces sp. YU58]|uniref:D-alanyl-D-alanine carboxypeptidase n=1 Tax=Streptomyces sp. SX92 TaxID=3158972 RepID=UPI0027B9A1BD|nr:D-alanyl-D-alanine carboxypeptidase [Streptomyces coralus]WLW54288.1 D-alanyl-D-alanine carboxypeptidase [Streptomyces coralus]
MAGESPDRSKQHGSSAEPTSGSAAPVPEARTGTNEPRDPRLAMTRLGGVDTATKVFSVREVADAARGASRTETGDETAGAAASSGGPGPEDADARSEGAAREGAGEERGADTDAGADSSGDEPPAGDDRLRDAVAAWVAKGTGGAEGAQDAGEGGTEAEGAAEGSGGEQEAVEPTQDETEDQGGSSAGATDAETDETPDERAEAGASGGDAGEEAAQGDRSDAEAESRDAEGDDVVEAEGREPVTAGAAEAGSGSPSGAGTDDEADADTEAEAEADADAESGAAREDGTPASPDAEDTDADGAKADAETDAKAGADTEGSDASDSKKAGAAATAAPDAEAGDAAADGTTPDATASPDAEDSDANGSKKAGAAATAAPDAGTDAKAGADAEDADAERPKVAASSDAKGADPKGSGSPEDGDGGPVVDQPTAVFKAPRVTGPAVDQPTTMLKLGGVAKAGESKPGTDGKSGADTKAGADAKAEAGKKPGTDSKPGGDASAGTDTKSGAADKPGTNTKPSADTKPGSDDKPGPTEKPGADANAERKARPDDEREAERTSRFVALKPLDDPATRNPARADATTAFPRVSGRTDATTALPQVKGRPDATAAVPQVGPERTTQQPLPPKPPLDLLAELTNTPPPPDTPVRTAVRRVKIWTPLVLLLAVVFAVVQSVRPLPTPELQLTAEDSFTFDGAKVDIPWPADGQAALDVQGIGTFGSSGEQKPVPIASVAKVMTAYVILRDHPLKSGADGPKIEIDATAEKQSNAGQESTVDVTAGDSISQREALESILIASANNVARLLARWDAGSEKAFVKKMNDAAADLGMKNTTYTDPSGLNNTTVSTAVDQVKLGKKAMEYPAFREVAAMMSYIDYKGQKHDNWNRLVGSNNVVGIKTGTTTSALGNLVFAAKKDVNGETRRIVGAVVRQPAGGADNTILGAALFESDKLIRAAQDALRSETILKKGDVVGYVDDGLGGHTPVVLTKNVTAVGWAGLTVKLTFTADDLPHTAKAGTKVGSLTVGDGSGSAVKVPVALQDDLVEPGFTDKLTRLG